MPVLLKRGVVHRSTRCVLPRQSYCTPSPSGAIQPLSFHTVVRGTRHHDVRDVRMGDTLRCTRQPDNPADANAVVLQLDATPVGYLPREVASQVAPWMDADRLELSVLVTRIAKKRTGIEIHVTVEAQMTRTDANEHTRIEDALMKAAESSQGSYSDGVLGRNLGILLSDVRKHFDHILKPEECILYDQLMQLSHQTTALLTRLYSRKANWFRVTQLVDNDGDAIDTSITQLMDFGFLKSTACLPLEDRLTISIGCLTVEEIRQFLRELRSSGVSCRLSGNKDTLVRQLEPMRQEFPERMTILTEIVGVCVGVVPHVREALRTAEHLYFLDPARDLSAFLLQDLDIMKWPSYSLSMHHPIFHCRPDFEAYFNALQLSTSLTAVVEAGRKTEIEQYLEIVWMRLKTDEHKKMTWHYNGITSTLPNPPPNSSNPLPLFLARFTATWIFVSMATTGIAYLEKQRRYEEAVGKLRHLLGGNACPSKRGTWWYRLVVNLQHLSRPNEALETCTSALADTWVRHGDRVSIQRQVLKLSKPPRKWKLPEWAPRIDKPPEQVTIEAVPTSKVSGVKSQFLSPSGKAIGVEALALEYYASAEYGSWKGIHTENAMWHTLFGVLFWDIIFSDVDDVFRSPFQSAPLDFCTDAFFFVRHDQIEHQLKNIQEKDVAALFSATWLAHKGEMCQGVNWDGYPLEQYIEMIGCIGGDRLASVCRLMAEDYKAVSGGLPDLFLWNVECKECRLVEVKGPNDRLSDQQRAWLTVLSDIEFRIEVFKIQKK